MKNTTLLVLLALSLPACLGPKAKATGSVDRIADHAVAAQQDAAEARPFVTEEGVPPFERLTGHLAAIADEAMNVARPNIEKLKDPESLLEKVWYYASRILIGLAILFSVYFLANAGLLPMLGPIISWLWSKGMSLSSRITSEAALAVEASKDPKTRELIAAKRAARADFNGAFIRAKNIAKSKETW